MSHFLSIPSRNKILFDFIRDYLSIENGEELVPVVYVFTANHIVLLSKSSAFA